MYQGTYIIQYYTDDWHNCCNNAGELIEYNKLDDAKFVANKVYNVFMFVLLRRVVPNISCSGKQNHSE